MKKEKFMKDLFSDHFAPYILLIENGYDKEKVFELFRGSLLPIVEKIVDNMTEKEMFSFWTINC